MTRMKMLSLKTLVGLAALGLALTSCALFVDPPARAVGPTGTLSISPNLGGGSRTILPQLPVIDHYVVTLTKAATAPISESLAAAPTVTLTTPIPVGVWSLVVTAYKDATNSIGTSLAQNVTITSATTTTTAVTVTPLTTGNGSLHVVWDLSALTALIPTPVDSGSVTLVPYPTGTAVPISPIFTGFPAAPSSVSLDVASLPAGTYLLSLKLTQTVNAIVHNKAPISEIVQIYGNLLSSKTLVLTAAELTSPPAAPTGLSLAMASPVYGSLLRLTWVDNANTENGFRVYRGPSQASWTLVDGAIGPNAPFADETYFDDTYWVVAYNAFGESDPVSLATIPVASITIPVPASINLEMGNSLGLSAVFAPVNATNQNLQWFSSSAINATVDAKGVVVAGNSAGSVNITCQTAAGPVSAPLVLTIVPAAPPRWGLVGEWMLNTLPAYGTNGSMPDTSPTASAAATTTWVRQVPDRFGTASLAGFFNGVQGGYVENSGFSSPTYAGLTANPSYTISCWVVFNKLYSAGLDQPLVWLGADSGVFDTVAAIGLKGTQLESMHYGDDVTFAFTPMVGVWYHVLVTYDAMTRAANLFVNGTAAGSGTHTGPLNLGPGVYLASEPSFRKNNAKIDDVRIYNRPLLPSEIQNLYKEGGWAPAVGSVRVWPETMALVPGATQRLSAGFTLQTPGASPQAWGSVGTWTSSTPGIATVDNSGLVTAVSAGVATLTYTDPSAGTATATIHVLTPTSTKIAYATLSGGSETTPPGAAGVYKSLDGGLTWTQLTSLFSATGVQPDWAWSSVTASANGQSVWACNSDYNASRTGYIYHSTDGGTTWSQVVSASAPKNNWTSIASSANGKSVVAVSYYGAFGVTVTKDGGLSWATPTGTPGGFWGNASISADGKYIKVAAGGGANQLWGSSDFGATLVAEPGLASAQYGGLGLSGDGSSSWVFDTTGAAHQLVPPSWVAGSKPLASASYWPNFALSWSGGIVWAADFEAGPGGLIYKSIDALSTAPPPTWATSFGTMNRRWTSVSTTYDGQEALASADNYANLQNNLGTGGIALTHDGGATWDISGSAGANTFSSVWIQPSIPAFSSATTAPGASQFVSAAGDNLGNVYFAGSTTGNTATMVSDGVGTVTIPGVAPAGKGQAALVKYNPAGHPVTSWGPTLAGDISAFNGSTVDYANNVVVVGGIWGGATFNFFGGAPVGNNLLGQFGAGPSPVIVKYDPVGNPLWSVTTSTAQGYSAIFTAVTTDPAGDVYAVGRAGTTATPYTFAPSVSVNAGFSPPTTNNLLLVRFNGGTGGAIWGTTFPVISSQALPVAVGYDSPGGNVIVGGQIMGSGTFQLDAGTTNMSGVNPVGNFFLTSYPANNGIYGSGSPSASWWSAPTIAAGESACNNLAIHPATGDIYAVGFISGVGNTNFGAVTAPSTSPGKSALLIKYSMNGSPLWAKVVTGPGDSVANGVTVDAKGNVYFSGYVTGGTGAVYNLGSLAAAAPDGYQSGFVAEFDALGNERMFEVVKATGANTQFLAVATDKAGGLQVGGAVAGAAAGPWPVDFGFGNHPVGTFAGLFPGPGGNALQVKLR